MWRLTSKRGVDVVLDMVGGTYFERNLRSLAPEGRLAQIAFLQGSKVEVDLRHIMMKRLTVTGSTLRASPQARKVALARALRERVWPLFAQGKLKVVVGATFPLDEAAKAHALMESGALIGKIILAVRPSLTVPADSLTPTLSRKRERERRSRRRAGGWGKQ